MLEYLAKKDSRWRELALTITKDKSQADDLVNDMYLKLHGTEKKEVTDGFIFFILRNMFLDGKRKKKKEIPLSFINTHKELFIQEECNKNELITLFNKTLSSIPYINRELAIEGMYMSTRQLANKYGINNVKVWRKQKEAKDELIKIFKDTYNKYK